MIRFFFLQKSLSIFKSQNLPSYLDHVENDEEVIEGDDGSEDEQGMP